MRFLCLPGYLQSGKVFAEKSSGIRKAFTKKLDYQLDYIDPPVVIKSASELPFSLGDGAEASEKWQKIVDNNCNRCWWQHDSSADTLRPYVGFDESLEFVKEYIKKNGPYDGIFGFSQGAAMAAIVSRQEPAISFALLVLPFIFTTVRSADDDRLGINYEVEDVSEYTKRVCVVPGYEELYANTDNDTRTVVIYGKADAVVPPIRSRYLATFFKNCTELEHEGGHLVPNKKPLINQLLELVGGRNNL